MAEWTRYGARQYQGWAGIACRELRPEGCEYPRATDRQRRGRRRLAATRDDARGGAAAMREVLRCVPTAYRPAMTGAIATLIAVSGSPTSIASCAATLYVPASAWTDEAADQQRVHVREHVVIMTRPMKASPAFHQARCGSAVALRGARPAGDAAGVQSRAGAQRSAAANWKPTASVALPGAARRREGHDRGQDRMTIAGCSMNSGHEPAATWPRP